MSAEQIIKSLIEKKATPEQIKLAYQTVEKERCYRDVFYFINKYVKIEDRDVEGLIIPFKLWDSQVPVLTAFLVNRLIQVMKANQLGLTWLIIAYATWRLVKNSGFSVKAISETEIKAKEIIRRIDFILRYLPDWFISTDKLNGLWYETTALSVTIHHPKINDKPQEDSVIQAFASSPTAGAGFTANLFLFDEWALQEYAREIWTYAFPTINRPTGGQVIGISTIERGTLFEDIWRGVNGFKKIFLGWFSDPRRDQKWYDNTIIELGLDETRKHYPATPEEALAIPGGAFFNEFNSKIHLKKPFTNAMPYWYRKYRFIDYGRDMLACYFAYMDDQGFVRIYKEVYEPGLVIGQAAYHVLKASGARVPDTVEQWDMLSEEKKKEIAKTSEEKIFLTYAPPDLFAISNQTGKPSSDVWEENGISLTKVKNDFEEGCLRMSEWLHPFLIKDEQTGIEYTTAKLTIDGNEDWNCAPNLVHSLLNIQKDKKKSNVYATQPHDLTHAVDSLRAFCTEMMPEPVKPKKNPIPEHLQKKLNKYKILSVMSE